MSALCAIQCHASHDQGNTGVAGSTQHHNVAVAGLITGHDTYPTRLGWNRTSPADSGGSTGIRMEHTTSGILPTVCELNEETLYCLIECPGWSDTILILTIPLNDFICEVVCMKLCSFACGLVVV